MMIECQLCWQGSLKEDISTLQLFAQETQGLDSKETNNATHQAAVIPVID